MLSSILAIVFVLKLSRNSDRYSLKLFPFINLFSQLLIYLSVINFAVFLTFLIMRALCKPPKTFKQI